MSTSLEILLQPRAQATPRPTHCDSLDARPGGGSSSVSAANLERCSVQIAHALVGNARTPPDIDGIEQLLAPERLASGLGAASEDACEVLHVSADVDEEHGVASVWVLARVADGASGAAAEAAAADAARMGNPAGDVVVVLQWRRKKGVWECFAHSGLRGVAGY